MSEIVMLQCDLPNCDNIDNKNDPNNGFITVSNPGENAVTHFCRPKHYHLWGAMKLGYVEWNEIDNDWVPVP